MGEHKLKKVVRPFEDVMTDLAPRIDQALTCTRAPDAPERMWLLMVFPSVAEAEGGRQQQMIMPPGFMDEDLVRVLRAQADGIEKALAEQAGKLERQKLEDAEKCPNGWTRTAYGFPGRVTEMQVMPINDTREHVDTKDCWCEPRLDLVNEVPTYVHNSADGREAFQRGERKPS